MVIHTVSWLSIRLPPLPDLGVEPGSQRVQHAGVRCQLLMDLFRRDGDLDIPKACEHGLPGGLCEREQWVPGCELQPGWCNGGGIASAQCPLHGSRGADGAGACLAVQQEP